MPGGRPPKPTALKQLGNTLQPSRTNAHEPVPDVCLPEMPDWISDKAAQYWNTIGPLLLNMRVVTAGDGTALSLLVETLAEWQEARQQVHENGLTYATTTESGSEIHRPYPQVAIASDAMKRALRMMTEFGLTPASRSKVSALGGEKDSDPLDGIMRGLNGKG